MFVTLGDQRQVGRYLSNSVGGVSSLGTHYLFYVIFMYMNSTQVPRDRREKLEMGGIRSNTTSTFRYLPR